MAESYTEITLGAAASGTNGVDNVNHGPWTFDYINTGDIEVRVKVSSTWHPIVVSSVNATTKIVTLAAAPNASTGAGGAGASAADTLRIYRATSLTPIVDFQAGSRIAEADLDNAYRQGLFAAQEVAEDANTTGGSGTTILTTNSVALAHMTDDSIDTDELVDDAVTTAKIDAGAVGATELASTLNLTGKTITYPAGSIGEEALKTDLDLSGNVLTLPVKNGEILDRVSAPADGNNQLTKHTGVGVWTWPTAAVQELTDTMADVVGSVVCYTPPTGTSRVEYEYNFTVARDGDTASLGLFKLYIAGAAAYGTPGSYTEVTNAKFTVGSGNQYGTRAHFKWVFNVGNTYYGSGGGDDTAFGAVGTWGASRFIKIMGREWDNASSGDKSVKLNQMYFWDDSTAAGGADDVTEWTSSISYPVLTITSVR